MADRLKQMDVNSDGIIQGSEIPEQFRDRMLSNLDKNGDGNIDKAELMQAATAMGKGGKGKKRGPSESQEPGGVKPKRPGAAEE